MRAVLVGANCASTAHELSHVPFSTPLDGCSYFIFRNHFPDSANVVFARVSHRIFVFRVMPLLALVLSSCEGCVRSSDFCLRSSSWLAVKFLHTYGAFASVGPRCMCVCTFATKSCLLKCTVIQQQQQRVHQLRGQQQLRGPQGSLPLRISSHLN